MRGDQAPRDEADIDTGLYYRLKYVILCDLPGILHIFFVPFHPARLFSIQHQIENRQRNNQRIPKLSPHTKKITELLGIAPPPHASRNLGNSSHITAAPFDYKPRH